METLFTRVAGVDVHKEILVITTLVGEGTHVEQRTLQCSTLTEDLDKCGRELVKLGVTDVAMESTGIYWKPVYNVWKKLGLRITLGNAQHIKNVPGRKTDVSDSEWIARLHRNGLIRPSFIPEEEFQQLRALNRHRIHLGSDLTRVKNRVQKVLEDGNVKLGSMLSNVFGVAGISVLRAIGEGTKDADVLLELIQTNVKKNREEIRKSLTNCLNDVHCFQIKEYLVQFDQLQASIDWLSAQIGHRMVKYSDLVERLDEIPGIDRRAAEIILAEATVNVDTFKEDRNFAAWAGVAPGNKQSAKKESSNQTWKPNSEKYPGTMRKGGCE